MISVLLVEDDLDLAATVVQYLQLEEIQCDHANNGISGLHLLQKNRYDALLLDLNLPRMDGISVCENIRASGNDTPVLMLTARDQLSDKIEGFQAGTDDFLVKPFDMEELVLRVQALTRRRSGQVQRLACGDLTMDLTRRQAQRGGQPLHLSPVGWKLLEALLRESPAAVSREKLQASVWGDDPPDSNSLKVHMYNLRKVLESDSEQTLLHTVKGYGFALYSADGDDTE
ncbi:MAG: response regulator transcription factor [Ketobacter sp.]|nr:MAG: DNA-binding response regulator [Ketobacter sp.]